MLWNQRLLRACVYTVYVAANKLDPTRQENNDAVEINEKISRVTKLASKKCEPVKMIS